MSTNSIFKNINDEIDLGPIPELQRHNVNEAENEDEEELIADRSYEDFQNDFIMPLPCSKCYRIACCEEFCEEEIKLNLVPCRLDFDIEDKEDVEFLQQPENLPEVVPKEYENANYQ